MAAARAVAAALAVGAATSARTSLTRDAATAWFDADAYLATGWAQLEVRTNASFPDDAQAYDAGFVEGALTQHMTFQFAINAHGGRSTFSPALADWVATNNAYMAQQVAQHPGDTYWHHVNLTLTQWRGFRDGYKATAPADEQLTDDALLSLTLIGDMDDLCPALGCTTTAPRGHHTCKTKAECDAVPEGTVSYDRASVGNGHCSILIRPIGSSFTPSDIFFGHTTWDPYTLMLRVMKHYDFAYAGVAAQHAVFSR